MVGTTIADNIDEAITGNIIYKPRDLIGMGFYHYLVLSFRVDDANCSTIIIYVMLIDKRLDIIEPQFLTFPFKTSGRRIIDIGFEEF